MFLLCSLTHTHTHTHTSMQNMDENSVVHCGRESGARLAASTTHHRPSPSGRSNIPVPSQGVHPWGTSPDRSPLTGNSGFHHFSASLTSSFCLPPLLSSTFKGQKTSPSHCLTQSSSDSQLVSGIPLSPMSLGSHVLRGFSHPLPKDSSWPGGNQPDAKITAGLVFY